MDVSDFKSKTPELLPEKYLAGNLEGWGVLESALGALKSRYTVKASGIAVPNGVNFNRDLVV